MKTSVSMLLGCCCRLWQEIHTHLPHSSTQCWQSWGALSQTLTCEQDGTAIKPSERIAAQQALPQLAQQLHQELLADGIDPQAHSRAEDDSLDIENVQENG